MLKFLAALAACCLLPVAGQAATLTATPETAAAVIKAAPEGDTVVLAAGAYAPVIFQARGPLIIDARAATVTRWEFRDARGVAIDGGVWLNGCTVQPCYNVALLFTRGEDLKLSRLDVRGPDSFAEGYGVQFRGSTRVSVTYAHFARFKMGLGFTKTADLVAREIACTANRSDCVNLAQVRRFKVEDVVCHGTVLTAQEHPDCVQGWSRPDAPPTSDGEVRRVTGAGNTQLVFFGNHRRLFPAGYVLADGTVLAEATELDDGGFDRITIEDSDGYVAQPNGITVSQGRGVTLRNNRIRTFPGAPFLARINTSSSTDVTRCGNSYAPALGKPGLVEPPCEAAAGADAAQVAALEAQVATLSGRIDGLTAQLATATTDVAALKARVDRLIAERAWVLAKAIEARKARAKNAVIDQIVTTLSAPAP